MPMKSVEEKRKKKLDAFYLPTKSPSYNKT
jgi:hypothetical protein